MNPIAAKRSAPLPALALLAVFVATGRPAWGADPTMSECIAANDSAIKLRGEHSLRQARNQALVCAASSCPREVRDECQKRVTDLNTAIPSIVFEVKDASGNDLSAVMVTMDGQPFATRLDGTAISLDPGDHAFSFAAAGQPVVEKRVVIYEGEKGRRERIQVGAAVSIAPPAAAQVPVLRVATPPETSTATVSTASGLGGQQIAGLTLGGIGVVGIGVGAVLGVLSISAWSNAKSACGPGGPSNCMTSNPASVTSDHDTAQTDGTVSTVAFVAGGALAATGLVVFLTGGHHGHEGSPAPPVAVVPRFGPGQAGVALSVAF